MLVWYGKVGISPDLYRNSSATYPRPRQNIPRVAVRLAVGVVIISVGRCTAWLGLTLKEGSSFSFRREERRVV